MQDYSSYIYIGGSIFLLVIVILIVRITSHKRSVKKTGALNQRLEVEKLKSDIVLNSIEDGVIVADANQVIQVFNPAASRLTGWPVSDALHLDYKAVIHLVDEKNVVYTNDKHPFAIAGTLGKTVRDNSAVLVAKDNKHLSVNISVSPLLDDNKRVTGVVGIIRDVSQERQEEHKRAEFISTASHEMRTPVAAIEGYLALAMNDKVSQIDSKAKEYLLKAHASTQHLGELFQDLLTSAKAEDGRLINHPEVVELGKYLEQLTEELKFAAQKKGLGIELIKGTNNPGNNNPNYLKVIQPLYYVHVDPNRFREVITNLFDNAVKYTPTGKITLGITGDQKVVQFSIKDTGAGIPAEDMTHLFQKFYRVDSSATRTIGGTGLGLFICRRIVELYNGQIWVESEVNKGSTFYINLPRLNAEQAEDLRAVVTPGQASYFSNSTKETSPTPVPVTKQTTP